MVLGSYYLTILNENEPGAGKIFRNPDEARTAYDAGVVGLHAPIKVRVEKIVDGEKVQKLVETTVGRIIFNDPIPQDLRFVDRSDPAHDFDYEVGFVVTKKTLGQIINRCTRVHGIVTTAGVLDKIKAQGYKFSTRGAITISVADMEIPPEKAELISAAEKEVDKVTKHFRRGLISEDERYAQTVAIWDRTTTEVTKKLQSHLDPYNPINMMSVSGARGSIDQIRQLCGMRGLIANTSGRAIDVPIRANFREGLSALEYFISSRGARKGQADTALRTADSGYLTRRLVDVSQDVIIREDDCGSTEGVKVREIRDGDEKIEDFASRLIGRFPVHDVVDPKTGEVLVPTSRYINDFDADRIIAAGIEEVELRSVLYCNCKYGVCAKCYGANLATSETVNVGEAVGIIAAQSIGEPGTQLTMRTFHTGGVASASDITQGLPRVQELFEARRPKITAILAEFDGVVSLQQVKNAMYATVTNADTGEEKVYQIPYGVRIKVQNGDSVTKGQAMTAGAADPQDILRILGVADLYEYITAETQKVYQRQGVNISDKHIEIIIRQMMKKLRVTNPGSSGVLAGTVLDRSELRDIRMAEAAKAANGEEFEPLECEHVLLGITKSALATESFLSAASFQETAKILTEAAIKGKTDMLIGLKENVIIGKLIPAGTGLERYRNVQVVQND